MDNAQKAIMIGVGLFITIIIISAVLLIVKYWTYRRCYRRVRFNVNNSSKPNIANL